MSKDPEKNKKRISVKKGLLKFDVRSIYLLIYDILAVNAAYIFALMLRFDMSYSSVPSEYITALGKFAPFYTVISVAVFLACGLYNSLWEYASFSELNRIALASGITTVVQIAGTLLFVYRMPISYYFVGAIVQMILLVIIRFSFRYIRLERSKREVSSKARENVMLIGAGSSGAAILKELRSSPKTNSRVVCFIDDDRGKWGRRMMGVPVAGGRDVIIRAAREYDVDKIMLAMPSATAKQKRDILAICQETDCELQSLPGLYQLANGEVTLQQMKPVAIEDLLGRDQVEVNMDEIYDHISGKVVLVTGGGGSIGSELCRQIAQRDPKQLIIFDIYENNAYDIEQELKRRYGDKLNLVVLIGSVRDSRRIETVFGKYRPQLVYHAAAHKHVPLMESSPNEAIKNNVIGTYKTGCAALRYGAERFVLISTDKAVNPVNIMGASKRLCEMVIQSLDAVSREGRMDILPFVYSHADKTAGTIRGVDPNDSLTIGQDTGKINVRAEDDMRSRTRFVAVRFGNVLGSNGSVVPLFKKQIAEGGPVTVTHPDVVRYFMTIPEAVSLVLQAGVYAKGGDIFVLDMGEPVRIDDMARNLIRLSGLTPDVDIKIEYTGLRSGEKLYEERLMAEEGLKSTANEKIHIGKPVPFDVEEFLKQLEELANNSYENSDDIVEMVEKMVSTFHPAGAHPGEAVK